MKRTISIALVVVFLVCACSAPDVPDMETNYPQPEGLFVYYNLSESRLGMGGGGPFGLVNSKGEVVVPCEHDYIGLVTPLDYYDAARDIEAFDRFFMAHKYPENLQREELNPSDSQAQSALAQRDIKALISPEGDFLTGFDYYNIIRDSEGIVGQRADDPSMFVRLDRDGGESDLPPDLLADMRRRFSWMLWEESYPIFRTGPDVPDQGFDDVIDLPGGEYWGASTPIPEASELLGSDQSQPVRGKGKYAQEFRLYSAEGRLILNAAYNSLTYMEKGLYIASRMLFDGDEYLGEETYIIDEKGTPLAGPYEQLHNWGLSPYLVAISEGEAVVISIDNFHELRAITIPEESWINTMRAGDRPLMTIGQGEQMPEEPLRIYLLDNGEEIAFSNLAGYALEYCNPDLTRFIVNKYSSGKGDSSVQIVDRQGNVLADKYDYIYVQAGQLVAFRYDSENSIQQNYILDWDGNVLLDDSYSAVELLPGNAALVIRGDSVGIVDLGGNWIYRESIFQNLEK